MDAWKQFGRGYDHFVIVDRMLETLVDAQNIMDEHADKVLMPLAAANTYKGLVHRFLRDYQRVAYEAEGRGEVLWSMPSKFHWLWHLADRAKCFNPRRTNCLLDEDFVGKHKTLMHACAAGTELHRMSEKAGTRYPWAMHFQNLRVEKGSE